MADTTETAVRSPEDRKLAEELVERAREDGVDLVGPNGLLWGPIVEVPLSYVRPVS